MASKTKLNLSLTPEYNKFIDEQVDSGRYDSASDVVRDALRLLKKDRKDRESALRGVRRKIASGLRQLDSGKVHDGEDVFRELEQRSRRRRAKS